MTIKIKDQNLQLVVSKPVDPLGMLVTFMLCVKVWYHRLPPVLKASEGLVVRAYSRYLGIYP